MKIKPSEMRALDFVRALVNTEIAHYHLGVARAAFSYGVDGFHPRPTIRDEVATREEIPGHLFIRAARTLVSEGILKEGFGYFTITDEALRHKDTLRDLSQYKYPVEPT